MALKGQTIYLEMVRLDELNAARRRDPAEPASRGTRQGLQDSNYGQER